MEKIKSQFTLANFIEFLKLQLAGNILFWGTYIGFFVFHELLHWEELAALATASVIAHILFFIADSEWVFDERGKKGRQRKTLVELAHFAIFMGVNYFINLAIIHALSVYFDITPYIGQFISAMFFVIWNYVGLKYWVFRGRDRAKPKPKRRKRKSSK